MGKYKQIFSMDVRSLALFRVSLAILVLMDLLHRSFDLTAHYTDKGVLPRAAFYEFFNFLPYNLSIHALDGSVAFQAFLFGITALFAIGLLVGYRTQASAVLTWLMMLSLQDRNVMILYGGDVLLRIMLFWAIFLPLGQYFSFDAYFERKGEIPKKYLFSAASCAYLLQICFIYWTAAAFKWNEDWLGGHAVSYALNIDQFVTPWGLWLKQHKTVLVILTHVTLWLELIGPFLLFFPFSFGLVRTSLIALFVFLHLSFGLFLTLGLFPFISIVSWFPLLPSWFWEHVVGRWMNRTEWSYDNVKTADFENVLVAILIIYIGMLNVRSIYPSWRPPLMGEKWYALGSILHLNQKWSMFSRPLRDDGWYVIEGELVSGNKIDIFRGGREVDWKKPQYVSFLYQNDRWRKYMMNLWWRKNAKHRKYLADYLVKKWNQEHQGTQQLKRVKIYFVLERTDEDVAASSPRRILLQEYKSQYER
ncbi:MAG: HTTM domain-containing protein [Chlamydiales bacterium]